MGRGRFAGDGSGAGEWRGVLSGILQSGYSVGYLLAAIAARFLLAGMGLAPMFWIGGLPALLALYIRTKVPESEAWKQHRVENTWTSAARGRPGTGGASLISWC